MGSSDRRKKHRSGSGRSGSRHGRDDEEEDRHREKHRSHHDEVDGEHEQDDHRRKKKRKKEEKRPRHEDREEDGSGGSEPERRRRSSGKDRKRSRKDHDDDEKDHEDRRKKKSRKDDRGRKEKKKKHHRDESDGRGKKKAKKEEKRADKKANKKGSKRNNNVPDKSRLVALGDPPGEPPAQKLDPEKDYFAYHRHLWLYLFREEGVTFNDLTSEESREAFHRFVEKFNAGTELEAAYYDPKGLPPGALEECKTTRHGWDFRTSVGEDRNLKALLEGVHKQTEYDGGAAAGAANGAAAAAPTGSAQRQQRGAAEPDSSRQRSAPLVARDRSANRRLREHVKTVEEELTGGRKEGRERQIEKRREQGARIHGAAREREAAAVGVELDDTALYGGEGGAGEIGFQSALAREKKRASEREEKKRQHARELQRKEKEKQEQMLKKLGLSGIKPGEKIKIAPRKDPP